MSSSYKNKRKAKCVEEFRLADGTCVQYCNSFDNYLNINNDSLNCLLRMYAGLFKNSSEFECFLTLISNESPYVKEIWSSDKLNRINFINHYFEYNQVSSFLQNTQKEGYYTNEVFDDIFNFDS